VRRIINAADGVAAFQGSTARGSSTGMKTLGRGIVCGLLMAALCSGCVASSVRNGALIGAGIGAVGGTGVGYALSNEDLLGSGDSPEHGDTSLPKGETILAGLAIGTAVGAIVGAMVGHQREAKYVRRTAAPPPPPDSAQVDPIIGKF